MNNEMYLNTHELTWSFLTVQVVGVEADSELTAGLLRHQRRLLLHSERHRLR